MWKPVVLLYLVMENILSGAYKRLVTGESSGDWRGFRQFPNCSHLPKPCIASGCLEYVTTAFPGVPGGH